MNMSTQASPGVLSIEPDNIPAILKCEKRWIPWRADAPKPNGKFGKIPIDPTTGLAVNATDPTNWQTFEEAIGPYRLGLASGVGFALSDKHPIEVRGTPYFVAAVDLDNVTDQADSAKAIWCGLEKPYIECSPSGLGLRMFALTAQPLKGGNAGNGRELYFSGRFMTVTGRGGKGELGDRSTSIAQLEQEWFGHRSATPPVQPFLPTQPETKANVERVLTMLDAVSSDTDYETWRSIVWSVVSTGWASASSILHQWSRRAAARYDQDALDKLIASFDPSRGISIATLKYHARAAGYSESAERVQQANGQSMPSVAPPSALMTAAELKQQPAVHYAVERLLPAKGLAAIYGKPGAGKSFLALDLANSLSSGATHWFGKKVKQRPIVYVALEGQAGLKKRVTAIELHVGQECSVDFCFYREDLHLLEGESLMHLEQQIRQRFSSEMVVIIDTLNQAAPGADENSSADMGKIISAAKTLAANLNSMVILVHHAGKDGSRGLRGHSSLLAAMDLVIEVKAEPTGHSWKVTKSKDDEVGEQHSFDLVRYTVGRDEMGDLSSCAVKATFQSMLGARKPPTGKNQIAALNALKSVLSVQAQPLRYSEGVSSVADALDAKAGRKIERAKAALESLISGGHLLRSHDTISLPPT